MGNPLGPLSGGMEAHQAWAHQYNEKVKQHEAQRQQPAPEAAQPQESSAPSRAELEAAARQRNLEENDRRAEIYARERTEREKALMPAQALSMKQTSNRDQQHEAQRQQPAQEAVQPQETSSRRAELEAAARQRNLEENERRAEIYARERAERQKALMTSNRDQQLEQQRHRDGREI